MELQALIRGSSSLTTAKYPASLAWAFNYVLDQASDKHFWSAALVDLRPRSVIAIFPAKVSEATLMFEKGLNAEAMVDHLSDLMAKLVGGPPQLIPQSESGKAKGFEIRIAHKMQRGEKEGLPVALVFAVMC